MTNPANLTTPTLPISSITVLRDSRQRREIKSTSDLEASISKVGLLSPIIVRFLRQEEIYDKYTETFASPAEFILVAGERRLQACTNLGWTFIPIRFLSDLSPIEQQVVELEENIKRKDLSWQDFAKAVERIHNLFRATNPVWSQRQTGEELSLSTAAISEYCRVAECLEEPRIAACSSVREAANILSRRDQRAMGEALQELLEDPVELSEMPEVAVELVNSYEYGNPTPIPGARLQAQPQFILPTIQEQSFLTWAPSYSGQKFNFIHCDFPYGIQFNSGPQGKGSESLLLYEDSADVYFELLDCFAININRLMSISSHLMFWYSERHLAKTLAVFRSCAPDLTFYPYPLIWHKTDNAGISSDPKRRPRHIYETCLLGTRGDRNLIRTMADCYGSPTDHKLHPSTKPEPMLRHFMTMLVDNTTRLLDPTCGSGSALRAADSLGASTLLGLEIDSEMAKVAELALKNSRTLRSMKL